MHYPLRQLFWECTLKCNLSCLHCGSDCKKTTDTKDMPLDHFLPVLDNIKLHQPNTKTIVFTVGGEPLVRQDIVECGREITKKGFYWGLVSNAMLIDASMMRELSRNGLCSLAIELQYSKKAIFNIEIKINLYVLPARQIFSSCTLPFLEPSLRIPPIDSINLMSKN